MREHTIVTISRQYGSGGREVAEILAKKMQVRCYGRQIVYLAAEKIGNGDLDVESILKKHIRCRAVTAVSSADVESEAMSSRTIIRCIKSRQH